MSGYRRASTNTSAEKPRALAEGCRNLEFGGERLQTVNEDRDASLVEGELAHSSQSSPSTAASRVQFCHITLERAVMTCRSTFPTSHEKTAPGSTGTSCTKYDRAWRCFIHEHATQFAWCTPEPLSRAEQRIAHAVSAGFDVAGELLLEAGIGCDLDREIVPAVGVFQAPMPNQGLVARQHTLEGALAVGVELRQRRCRSRSMRRDRTEPRVRGVRRAPASAAFALPALRARSRRESSGPVAHSPPCSADEPSSNSAT